MSKAVKNTYQKQSKNIIREDIEDKDTMCVLFYATWCYFSRRFLPIFEEYAENNPNECLSVIIDDKPDVCDEYAIEYYPTVILFKKGKVHKRLDSQPGIGLNKTQLTELIDNN